MTSLGAHGDNLASWVCVGSGRCCARARATSRVPLRFSIFSLGHTKTCPSLQTTASFPPSGRSLKTCKISQIPGSTDITKHNNPHKTRTGGFAQRAKKEFNQSSRFAFHFKGIFYLTLGVCAHTYLFMSSVCKRIKQRRPGNFRLQPQTKR